MSAECEYEGCTQEPSVIVDYHCDYESTYCRYHASKIVAEEIRKGGLINEVALYE